MKGKTISQETENKNEEQEVVPQKTDEIIPIEWSEIEDIYNYKQELNRAENYLASILVAHEKTKQDLLMRISAAQQEIYEKANFLRDNLNVSREFSYELKLPDSPEEKAYFVRKQG